MMTRHDIVGLLRRNGFSRADDIAALAVPCLVLASRRATRETATHLGGLPDLPRGRAWPVSSSGRPLTFIGQIDVAELAATVVAGQLPPAGRLGFFFDTEFGPTAPEFAITWGASADEIHPATPPEGARVLPTSELEPLPAWSFPHGGHDCPFVASLGLADDERDELADFLSRWSVDHVPRGHRLLGYAHALNDAYVGAALDTNAGLRERWFARPPRERTRLTDELVGAAREFRLCAAFCDDPDAGIGWGDGAELSFLVRRDAWAAGAFDQQSPTERAAAWCEGS